MALPNVAAGDYLRMAVTSFHTPTAQIGQNVAAFKIISVTGGVANIQDVTAAYLLAMQTPWAAVNEDTVSLSGIIGEQLVTLTGRVLLSFTAVDNVTLGVLTAGVAPSQVSPVVKKNTGFAGRQHRGRYYFPFVSQSFVLAAGELSAAGAAALSTFYSTAYGNVVLTTTAGTVVSLQAVLVHKGAPLLSDDIISHVCTGRFGTQRRRGDYGRPNNPLA